MKLKKKQWYIAIALVIAFIIFMICIFNYYVYCKINLREISKSSTEIIIQDSSNHTIKIDYNMDKNKNITALKVNIKEKFYFNLKSSKITCSYDDKYIKLDEFFNSYKTKNIFHQFMQDEPNPAGAYFDYVEWFEPMALFNPKINECELTFCVVKTMSEEELLVDTEEIINVYKE